ncbi:MAG: hypothetical protein H0V40_02265, partial [Actinobacteria bacterium]|nr:hypothetical protein [Actinomycetota bacterium]
MRAALEAGAAPVPAPRQLRAGTALAAPIAVLLGWSVLDGGGADPSGLFLLGTAAIVLLAGALVCVLAGLLPAPRPGRAGTVLAGAFACWVVWLGVSILWSIEADRSWDALNRGLVYAALLGLGMLGGALLPRAPQLLAGCLALLCALAIGWALAGKVVPALGPDVARSARLRDPVGYWNALALLVAMSLPLWLWLAARRGHAASLRALAAAAVVPAGVALLLTASRGGLVVAIVAVLVWLALSPARLEGLVALLLAVPVVGAIGAWALTRSALTSEGSAVAGRERAGLELGLVLVAGTALVLALAFAAAKAEEREPVTPQRRRRLLRATAALAGGAVVLSLAVAALSVDDPLGWVRARADEFRNPPSADVTQG